MKPSFKNNTKNIHSSEQYYTKAFFFSFCLRQNVLSGRLYGDSQVYKNNENSFPSFRYTSHRCAGCAISDENTSFIDSSGSFHI